MTGRHAGSTPPLEFTRRDWRPQLAAVMVPSLLYAGMTVFLLATVALSPGEGWWLRVLQLSTVLGRGVVEQLGWVFGILITIQLGCLIAVLGGQIHARNRRDEADLRTALGLFSVLPVVGLSPALTVAGIAAFRVGELRGALFVIVPALSLTIALSAFIGTFDVADELTKREFAQADVARAQQHVATLRGRPTAPFWRTGVVRSALLFVSVLTVSLILGILTGAPTPPSWVLWSFAALVLVSSTATVFVLGAVSASLKPALTADGVATVGLLLTAIFAMQIIVVPTLFVLHWQLGVSGLFAVLLLGGETVRVFLEAREARAGRESDGFWRGGGPISRVGTSIAQKAAKKQHDDARARVEKLGPKIARRVHEAPKAEGRRRDDGGAPAGG